MAGAVAESQTGLALTNWRSEKTSASCGSPEVRSCATLPARKESKQMFKALKIMSLASALKSKGNSQEAYSAVLELGRLGNDKAIELLISALARKDGVSRSAARELGRIRDERAIAPLIGLLGEALINQA